MPAIGKSWFNLMDVFEAVRSILAVRSYEDRPVPEDVIRRIVEGTAARSDDDIYTGHVYGFENKL